MEGRESPMPFALVTCGPAYEPIDEVRRITNHSTGELGTLLAETLSASGFDVLCLRGEGAGYPAPKTARVLPFSTNASLGALVGNLSIQPQVVFHAAALSDFLVHDIQGGPQARKIPSTAEVHIILRPAGKILPRLRRLFPEAADRRLEIRARWIPIELHPACTPANRSFGYRRLRCQWPRLRRRIWISEAR